MKYLGTKTGPTNRVGLGVKHFRWERETIDHLLPMIGKKELSNLGNPANSSLPQEAGWPDNFTIAIDCNK